MGTNPDMRCVRVHELKAEHAAAEAACPIDGLAVSSYRRMRFLGSGSTLRSRNLKAASHIGSRRRETSAAAPALRRQTPRACAPWGGLTAMLTFFQSVLKNLSIRECARLAQWLTPRDDSNNNSGR